MRTKKVEETTPLGANDTYTSPVIKTEMYNQIRGLVEVDQQGTLEIEESEDTVKWIKTDTITINSATSRAFRFNCNAYYARLKYTNGGTPQNTFFLVAFADPFSV
jgi:hypothetical protein